MAKTFKSMVKSYLTEACIMVTNHKQSLTYMRHSHVDANEHSIVPLVVGKMIARDEVLPLIRSPLLVDEFWHMIYQIASP